MTASNNRMEFISENGIRFNYWITVGDVINVNSWTADGVRHHGIWIRNCDGREWHCEGFPLDVNVTKGQRIAFGWCLIDGRDSVGQLVGVQNCSTGLGNVLSEHIAIALGVHRYGRNAFWVLVALSALVQLAYWLLALPDWMPRVSLATLACGVLGGSVLGLLVSCLRDPDPDRVIDTNLRNALGGVQYGFERTPSAATGRTRRAEGPGAGQPVGLLR